MRPLLWLVISTIAMGLLMGNVRTTQNETVVLEKGEGQTSFDRIWFAYYGDVDTDGKPEVMVALSRYHFNDWLDTRDEARHFLEFMAYAPDPTMGEGDFIVEIYKPDKSIGGAWKKVNSQTIWQKQGLERVVQVKVGDFNGDRLNEVFICAITSAVSGVDVAKVVQFKGNSYRVLYEGVAKGGPIELRDYDGDGKMEVIEKGASWHILSPEEMEAPQMRGHVYCMRIYKWNDRKKKWSFWKIAPDLEFEKKLSKDEVLRTPGAEAMLEGMPRAKLKEIYPRAFK